MFVMEFEFVDEGDVVKAFPLDAEGVVEGADFESALDGAARWLHDRARDTLTRGAGCPHGRGEHGAERGGRVVAVAVDVGPAAMPLVSCTEAARRLGVTPARVSQLCEKQLLESWRIGRTRMVSVESIEARLAARPKAGRPQSSLLYAKETATV